MEKTWKPMVGGILCIITGAFGVLWAISLFIGSAVTSGIAGIPVGQIPAFVPGLIMAWGVWALILSILAIVGGVYSLRRKSWGLALAGSIGAIFSTFILGIIALVFIAISKKEFE